MSLSSEDIERICSGWSNDLPGQLTRTEVRDIVCQMLYEMGVPPHQLALIMLLILDKYSMQNFVENAKDFG